MSNFPWYQKAGKLALKNFMLGYLDQEGNPINIPGTAGPQGPPGENGAPGDPGPAGPEGPEGPQGPQGLTGSQGPQGVQGIQGIQGNTGPQGPQGIQGDTGPQGPAGPAGADGADGAQGPQGNTGPQGPQGNTGAAGSPGSNGTDGKTVRNGTGVPSAGLGVDGDFYIQTDTNQIFGPKTAGAWGSPTSMIGPQGIQGIQGVQGIQGATGPQGTAGNNIGVHAQFPLFTNDYTTQQINATALSTIAAAANRLDFFPFIPARNITINELAIEVSTLIASSQARLGVYSSTAAGLPNTILAQSPTVLDCGSTGVKTSAISNLTLTAGTLYWLAVHSSSTQTYRGVAVAGLMPINLNTTLNTTYTCRRMTQTFASGLPTTPATTLTSSIVPWFRLKIA